MAEQAQKKMQKLMQEEAEVQQDHDLLWIINLGTKLKKGNLKMNFGKGLACTCLHLVYFLMFLNDFIDVGKKSCECENT